MKKLRANLRIQLRGLRLNQEINGKRYTPFNILAFYLPVLANYVTIHFSGSVITALTEGRSFWECFRYVLLSAGMVFAIYLVRRLIMRATMDMNWSSWYRREMYMTRKALSLDFAQAENPEISAMLGKAENNSQMYNGLAHQPILIRSAAVNLLSIVTAIGMSSGMLSARGDTTQGGILQWVNSPLFAALFVLFVLLLLVLSVWGNDAQSKRAFRAHQLFGKMHMVRRYYERRVLNESGSGEDIRIFREHLPDGLRAVAVAAAPNRIIVDLLCMNDADPARIYVTGFSMGGHGTVELAGRNPDLFAACVAICCGGTREEAERLKDMPIALYQGDYDETVRTELTRDFFKFLQEAGNTQCSYREYPLIAHNAWDICYNDYTTLDWLFAQRKK